MANHKCPNCGHRLRTAIYSDEPRRTQNNNQSSNGRFQSNEENLPPQGRFRSLFWFMNPRNYYNRNPEPQAEIQHIVAEHKMSRIKMIIREAKINATDEQMRELAYLYVVHNVGWARDTTCDALGVTQGWHNKLAKRFRHLMYIEEVSYNRFQLTDAGRDYLSRFLRGRPSAFGSPY